MSEAEVGVERRSRSWAPAAVALGACVWWAVLVGIYAVGLPLKSGPDEPEHLQYLDALAQAHRLAVLPDSRLAAAGAPASAEAQHPPLYYILLAAPRALTLKYCSEPTSELIMRLLSALLVLLAFLFLWKTARLLWPEDPWPAALAVTVAATLPQSQYMASLVNNASATVLFITLTLWLCARLLSSPERRVGQFAALGVVAGLVLLTKLTGLWVVLCAGLCALAACHSAAPSKARLTRLGAFAGVTVGLAGIWVARNLAVYGVALPERVTIRRVPVNPLQLLLFPEQLLGAIFWVSMYLVPGLCFPVWLLYGKWGLRPGVLTLVALSTLVWIAMLGGMRLRGWKPAAQPAPWREVFVRAVSWSLVALGLMFSSMVVRDWQMELYLGRYAWESVGAVALLCTFGLWRVANPRVRTGLATALVGLLMALSVVICHLVLVFYHSV